MDDITIFGNTRLSDVLKEIYENSKNKKVQVDLLVSDILSYITDAKTAQDIIPQIKDLLEVGVKNDDQLVKLAVVVQRIKNAEAKGMDDGILSEEEKNQLITNLEESVQDLQKKSDEIVHKTENYKTGGES